MNGKHLQLSILTLLIRKSKYERFGAAWLFENNTKKIYLNYHFILLFIYQFNDFKIRHSSTYIVS